MTDYSPVFRSAAHETAYLSVYDAAMGLWPIPYEEISVPTRFGATHVIVSGPSDASPLVLLHWERFNSTIWAPIIGDLSRRYRTYAVDVIGDAGKSIVGRRTRSRPDLALWLQEVLRGLDIEQAHLLGHSYGGFIAMNFALLYPTFVGRLALLAPLSCLARPNGSLTFRRMAPIWLPHPAVLEHYVRWLSFRGDLRSPVLDKMMEASFRYTRRFLALGTTPVVFTKAELAGCDRPTLVMVGDHETLYKPETAFARAGYLPYVETISIPACNHAIVTDQPAWVSENVLRFLDAGA
jgi:pimeloyl-ACP methyl ester carboxylesterase